MVPRAPSRRSSSPPCPALPAACAACLAPIYEQRVKDIHWATGLNNAGILAELQKQTNQTPPGARFIYLLLSSFASA